MSNNPQHCVQAYRVPESQGHRRFLPRVLFVLMALAAGSPQGLAAQTSSTPQGSINNPPHLGGRWSEDHQLLMTPVHFIVSPGDSTGFHSKITYWRGTPDGPGENFGGYLWWRDPVLSAEAFQNGTSLLAPFPTANYFDRPVFAPSSQNPFCASHVRLEDGGTYVSGGTEIGAGEVGTTQSQLLRDYPPMTWDTNASALAMHSRRWYSTASMLGSGRVLIHSGSTFLPALLWGGLSDSTSSGQLVMQPSSLVRRIGLSFPGDLLTPASPVDPTAPNKTPSPREFACESAFSGEDQAVVFGGRDLTDTSQPKYFNDAWILRRSANHPGELNSNDYDFSWGLVQPPSGSQSPAARYLHASTMLSDIDLVVSGGMKRSGSQEAATDEVWVLRLFHGTNNQSNTWFPVDLSGSTLHPAARCGHMMVTDPGTGRIFMFGGASSPSATPTDTKVYELALTYSYDPALQLGSYSGVWTEVPAASSGSTPLALSRFGKARDRSVYEHSGTTSDTSRVVVFGGLDGNGSPSVELRSLLLFTSGTSVSYQWQTVARSTGTQPVPSAGLDVSFSYEPSIGRVLVVGGRAGLAGTDATPSTAVRTTLLPPPAAVGTQTVTWQTYVTNVASAGTLSRGVAGGTMFVSGSDDYSRVAEVYDPYVSTNRYTELGAGSGTKRYHLAEWYPFMFVVPNHSSDTNRDRLVFEAGPRKDSWLLDMNSNETDGT